MPYAESVDNLRKRFEQELATTGGEQYHSVDIERVRTEEYQVKRFLVHKNGDERLAYEALTNALKWKKEFGIHERDDRYFPKEMWEFSGVEINGRDKEGRLIVWSVQRNIYAFKETALLRRQFSTHILEKTDRMAGESGFCQVTDTNGSGLSNVDLELNRFQSTNIEHYPLALRALYIVDLPWLLNSAMKIIVSFMNPALRERVHYIKREELLDYIDSEHIPVELGGSREKHNFPPNTLPLELLQSELGLSEKFIDRFYKHYKIKRINNNE